MAAAFGVLVFVGAARAPGCGGGAVSARKRALAHACGSDGALSQGETETVFVAFDFS